ncbi:MAG: 23S rRNA (adenine(2503)-C(2))-methyltransferase RlmN [Clostridiales bacterium]|jgi:23S rRNA (adenine2503-C2)-methyltransferase|nr:23S rRNA (adenine(2503)-C(2))-methyltransferase RlmN [Clostridiales bacterium]
MPLEITSVREKPDIRSLTGKELEDYFRSRNMPAFRAAQVRRWLDEGVRDFDKMTNLPLSLREELKKSFRIFGVNIEKKLVSGVDNTVKYLYALPDGETVESVLMQYHHGWSQCLSTQVGCKMGCAFCATGMGGFVRNLTPSEMLAQIEAAQQDTGVRVSSVVLMGMGEPLENFDNVLAFVTGLAAPGGVQIGMRHISLSTCGLVDRIYQLMEHRLQLTLSVSLHAPNDELRSRLMPVNRRWPLSQLLQACRDYFTATGRRISFEYAMIDGVNDTPQCAAELASLLSGMNCHVNLIPVNHVAESGLHRSGARRLRDFQQELSRRGINVTVRRTLGADIDASCGQLRRGDQ